MSEFSLNVNEIKEEVSNKFDKVDLTVSKAQFVNAPIINEFPLALECKCISIEEVDEGTTILVADIINASVKEEDLKGKKHPNLDDLDIILYDPISHYYRKIGEKVGNAFKDGLFFKNKKQSSSAAFLKKKALKNVDTLIIGGTSLIVYPASGLVRYFKGKNLVIINMSPTDYDKNSTLLIQGKIGEVLSNINC